jgi:AGZA family xanthine/uracil permease-like MFS transporter
MIVNNDATLVGLGSISSPEFTLAIIGLVVTAILLAFKVKGALLIGIIAGTIAGFPLGLTSAPAGSWAPPSLAPIFFKFDFSQVLTLDMFIILFTFLMVDMFDTVGTLIGVSTKAGLLTEDGKIPRVKQALFADAIGTTVGACLGTSTVTTYVESAAGVEEGGKTGLTALVAAILFFAALFLSPLFLMIPSAATAPALILVGLFMITPVKDIELHDMTEALPAFLTMFMMPLTYSISEGIVFGIVSYVILKACTGKAKSVPVLTYIIAAIFILKFFI